MSLRGPPPGWDAGNSTAGSYPPDSGPGNRTARMPPPGMEAGNMTAGSPPDQQAPAAGDTGTTGRQPGAIGAVPAGQQDGSLSFIDEFFRWLRGGS